LKHSSSFENKKSFTVNEMKLWLNAITCDEPQEAAKVSAAVTARVRLQPPRVILLATAKIILQGFLWSLYRAE